MRPIAAPELATDKSVPLLPLQTRLVMAWAAKYRLAESSDLNKLASVGMAFIVEFERMMSLS